MTQKIFRQAYAIFVEIGNDKIIYQPISDKDYKLITENYALNKDILSEKYQPNQKSMLYGATKHLPIINNILKNENYYMAKDELLKSNKDIITSYKIVLKGQFEKDKKPIFKKIKKSFFKKKNKKINL